MNSSSQTKDKKSELTFRVVVTKCGGSHVAQSYGTLAATVDKRVALIRVKLSRCDHLGQFFHVGWLYVHNI